MAVKMDPEKLVILKGAEAFRPVNEGRVEEYALILKRAGDRWPFPNDERDGIKVMAQTKEVKAKDGTVTIQETDLFIVLAGATRVSAAVAAKWKEVPVWVVRPKSGTEILRIGITSNVEHGARFTPKERDRLIKRCVAEGMTQDETADLFQIHKSTVSRVVRDLIGEDDAEKHARGGKARKGKGRKKSKKSKKGKAFKPDDFIQEGVIILGRMIEAHHEAIVGYAAGNDRAVQAMEGLASALVTLSERAVTLRASRPAETAPAGV